MAILGILSGVLLVSFGSGTASARAARCLSNMKNLANAAQTYGMATHYYPCAGNIIYMTMTNPGNGRPAEKVYNETPGWISANSEGMFPSSSYSQPATVSMYSDNDEEARYALTNGALWKYVSESHETYICPEHARSATSRTASKGGVSGASRVNWSYLMSAYFCYDISGRPRASSGSGRRGYVDLSNAEKRLLFSEVPFKGYNSWQPEGSAATTDTDAILQYGVGGLDENSGAKGYAGGGSGSEEIGVNHVSGRNAFAHVAFADGHVEKLRVPMEGKRPNTSGFAELTSWLCAGYDVSFDGNSYKRVR